jgi:outer membrane protein assembly factor BamB
MKLPPLVLLAALAAAPLPAIADPAAATAGARGKVAPPAEWSQWGQNAQHSGRAAAVGQPATRLLADFVYDPFVVQEKGGAVAGGDLLVHYQSPLIHGADVYMAVKSGRFTGPSTRETQTWNETRLHWRGAALVRQWTFASDWKPVPSGGFGGPALEPIFHAVLSGRFLYVPGAGGSLYQLDQITGKVAAHIRPFGPAADPDLFLCGPPAADASGNVYYNAIRLVHGQPWTADVRGAWLVKVLPNGSSATVPYAALVPEAPAGGDTCAGSFDRSQLPWPPSANAVAPRVPCGTQRPPVNLAPAVAPDGTVYTASVAHLADRTGYLVAVNPDLTPRWAASLRDRLDDGCNVTIPPTGGPGGCRAGARDGVDPAENRLGAGRLHDDSTASPVVAPDGSILLGTYTRYNYLQGHLMKFSAAGDFLAAYPFGWDATPAVYAHGTTYSIILKDNQYGGVGAYCDGGPACPPDRTANHPASPEGYFMTQLDADLRLEWRWQNTNTLSCHRTANGPPACVSDHPAGFEWCVNAAAVDKLGVVFANSEDGNLYAIRQDGTLRDHRLLDLAIGAAYTPLAIGGDGRIYSENDGHLFVLGGCVPRRNGRGCR